MVSDELDQFVANLLIEKGLTNIDDDVRTQLIADLKQRLLDQINRALIDALPDDKTQAFESLLDDGDVSDDQVTQFIADSGVDVKRVTTRTMLRFSELYLGRQKLGEEGQ